MWTNDENLIFFFRETVAAGIQSFSLDLKEAECVTQHSISMFYVRSHKPASDDRGGSHSKSKNGMYFVPQPVGKWAALF